MFWLLVPALLMLALYQNLYYLMGILQIIARLLIVLTLYYAQLFPTLSNGCFTC